jgi:hypothetical protein
MGRPFTFVWAIAAALGAASCSGSQRMERIPDPPAPMTHATLSGPLCERGGACRCRQDGEDAGEPGPDHKRFEFRLGPTSSDFWVTVGDMVLYKSKQRAQECFYVDLRPGRHKVALRATGPQGFGAGMTISEFGAEGSWWYDTFEFTCGAPGLCDQETLAAWKRRKEGLGNLHDRCGSVKVTGITWRTGEMPDMLHPSDLLLELVLEIHDFAPTRPPGDESCVRGG